jgi:serine/threonine-protein kinase RsbW
MDTSAEIVFPADLGSLYPMLAFVRKYAMLFEFSDAIVEKLELAAEEAFVNIVEHAYRGEPGTVSVACSLLRSPQVFEITFKDHGTPFMAVQLNKISYGLKLLHASVDSVVYRHEGDRNVLTLVKNALSP